MAAAGDVIAIASSSFYAADVDQATITSVTYDTPANVTTLGLDGPLSYTHLGVIVAGPDSRSVDMRAEVAVLNRWAACACPPG